MKRISLLGSTGSIGKQTCDVVRSNPDKLELVALVARSNVGQILQQIEEFHPRLAVLQDAAAAQELKSVYKGDTEILSGNEGILAAATLDSADTVLGALVGYAGLRPTLAAIRKGKNIALANKETLVAAGEFVTAAVREQGVSLTPVDSEHSAIFQCLKGNAHREVKRILITASGGPFRGKTRAELENVGVKECLSHPTWSMGSKVTVDSATLANKGLEIIEAHWLFAVPYDAITPVIHPQSIVHSMVEYKDGSVIAQLGAPDMRLPIQYALSYPERWDSSYSELDLVKAGSLTFAEPDYAVFPALSLAVACGKTGGVYPCVFNAANEVAVEEFLAGRLKFTAIAEVSERVVDAFTQGKYPEISAINVAQPTLDDIEEADKVAREVARMVLKQRW